MIEVVICLLIALVIGALYLHAWWTTPLPDVPETYVVGPVDIERPPPRFPRRDVLDDFSEALNTDPISGAVSPSDRLELLDELLHEADHETIRLELLVDRLGVKLNAAHPS